MKIRKFFGRIMAFLLIMVMVVSICPVSTLAAVNDIASGTSAGNTGIVNSTLGTKSPINWPVKIYDYLEDGMLFEYSSANGTTYYDESYSNVGGALYGGGAPMPITTLGSDYTADWVYTAYTNNRGLASNNTTGVNPSANYTKTPTAAVANKTPKYMRLTYAGDKGYANYCVCDFVNDWSAQAKNDVRYMTMVYRSSGITNFLLNSNIGSTSSWKRATVTNFVNSTEWTYIVIDLKAAYEAYGGSTSWSDISSNIWKMYVRPTYSSGGYLDLTHVSFFDNTFEAERYGKKAVAFDKNPGKRLTTATTTKTTSSGGWNTGNNLGFGMLLPSSGGTWALGGGTSTSQNGYDTYRIGYTVYPYGTGTYSSVFNDTRIDRNGTLLGDDNQIYFVTSTYANQDAYKAKFPNDPKEGYNMSDLDLDGYTLLGHATQGLMTVGLLEGELQNGRPVYREETVTYIAEMLEKSLVIPQVSSTGKYNYNFVKGVENSQYGTADGKALDLAQALRNRLGITFTSGSNKGSAPTFGNYAETAAKGSNLIGAYLDCDDYINTCMDAAYYLLNNLFVDNSYNQLQDDYKYLTLSNATLSDGTEAYVFDAGFANGADPSKLDDGTSTALSQDQYKAASQSAVQFSSQKLGGDGSISLGPVQAKDLYYYSGSARTTRFPFLPVTDAEGVYAGETQSYYWLEDGFRSVTKDFGTYANRNFNYVLASNGEFVYHEEDGLFFEFEGDDDVYLFINDQLVLDIGGAHSISNVSFEVNDYVEWAKTVLDNPSEYSAEDVERAGALYLENGEVASFDFYYMERHGYGANMRIVTNMHITDPSLSVDKKAYQGKEIEYGGIIDGDYPVEYSFSATNGGNTKLYNLTFEDNDIGVKLDPTNGLFVTGMDTPSADDDLNGSIVTDARGGPLEAQDLTARVTGYMPVDSGGEYKQEGHEYIRVTDGSGTHNYVSIDIAFRNNDDLKVFLKTLEGDGLDDGTIDDELTQSGSGLWVDATCTIRGIYYNLKDTDLLSGVFNNTVDVTATNRSVLSAPDIETLRSSDTHRVYLTAIPSYYQWAGNDLFMTEQIILDDATKESGNEGSMLHDYHDFFMAADGKANNVRTVLAERDGDPTTYKDVVLHCDPNGVWGFKSDYQEAGTYEFFLLMYLEGASGDVSTMTHGQYAIVRVLIFVTDVEDSTYVLDYGLSSEDLDRNGELFKNDELLGGQSRTAAKMMGISTKEPYYRNVCDGLKDYNRINFDVMALTANNEISAQGFDGEEDGYFTFNMAIPEGGKDIAYDAYTGDYTITESGTTRIHVTCPYSWQNLNLYYWYDSGVNNTWPGQAMNRTRAGSFTQAVPGDVPHIIITKMDNATGAIVENQTIDLHVNPGEEAWVRISGDVNSEGKLLATVEYDTQDAGIHAKVPEGWGDIYLYCWDTAGKEMSIWPGEQFTGEADENGFYTLTIPGQYTNVIVNNGKGNGKQTNDLIVYAGKETWITVNDTPSSRNEEMGVDYYGATASRSNETVKMHASVPENWGDTIYLYYWNSNGSPTGVTWPGLKMTKNSETGIYTVEGIPNDVTNIIINNGDPTVNAGDVGGCQTEDLLMTPGLETWFEVEPIVINTTVEANIPDGYGEVAFYFFNDNGYSNGEWPGQVVTDDDGDGVYTASVPTGATKFIVNNNNNGVQSQDLILTPNKVNSYNIQSNGEATTPTTTKLKIYPSDDWGDTVYVHHWNNAGASTGWPGEQVTTKDDSGAYVFEIPGDRTKFIVNAGLGMHQTGNIEKFYNGAENIVNVYKDGGYTVNTPVTIPTKNKADITYGGDAMDAGFTFTPTDFMDSEYELWMAIAVHETDLEGGPANVCGENTTNKRLVNIGKEVQMFKKITVVPANVVYYEDDFAGIKYNTSNTANIFTYIGKGSGSLSQDIDQSEEYGQDNIYEAGFNDEYSADSLTEVQVNEHSEFASFTFRGTGFEIIGHTKAVEAGTMMVTVYDSAGNYVTEVPVITEFDNGADGGKESIKQVPVIRITDLPYDEYTVKIAGVPIFDFSNFNGSLDSLIVKPSYLYIDGIRIFQPYKGNETLDATLLSANKSYTIDTGTYSTTHNSANLTDGVAATGNWESGSWIGFNKAVNVDSHGQGVVTIDLGAVYNLEKVQAHIYSTNTGASIGNPTYVEVYYSNDLNSQFKYAGNLDVATTVTDASYWAKLSALSGKEGRYVRVKFGPPCNNLYWAFVDEIEVYGKEVGTPGESGYYNDGESGAEFVEIRNLISESKSFSVKYDDLNGMSLLGGTTTWIENRNEVLPSDRTAAWSSNTVASVEDYLLAGPNNELYMKESGSDESSALAFYVQIDKTVDVHELQIAMRGLDYGQFTGQDASGINAQVQYGVYQDGKYIWRDVATLVSGTEQYYSIPVMDCPYDEVNDRYQVVIRVADTNITGLASFTTAKYNGISFCELNTDEIPDVIYTDELGNELVDASGNTLSASKFVSFIKLVDQMKSEEVETPDETPDETVTGTSTSSLGVLYDSFAANSSVLQLTDTSRIFIVGQNPSVDLMQTVQLAQTQYAYDGYTMDIVYGDESRIEKGDIAVYLDSASNIAAEGYEITVTDYAKVKASDTDGVLYGLNTLQKHFRAAGTNAIVGFTMKDTPDTKERTVHLDIARKYLTKDWVCNYIKELSWMGYNAIELHFSEDGGFRADLWDSVYYNEVPGVTGNDFSWACGSEEQHWVVDCPDPDKGKYLTTAEMIEILQTAKEYHLDVIPSFDTPQHVDFLTKQYYNLSSSGNTAIKNFRYQGTNYTLPTYINHRTTSSSNSRWGCLNLGDETIRKFAYAMYTDIAAFFKYYAGSSEICICGDEVSLTSTDTWNYADFVNYVNTLNGVLNDMGYTTRMYNDFIDRQDYIDDCPVAVPDLASNIEIVYWAAPESSSSDLQPASHWVSNRKVYSGINFWTYYVLRLNNTSGGTGRDARDPLCTWWSFYRNSEDRIYNEWNPTRLSAYTYNSSYTYSGANLAGGYFMVWNDYAGLNTEVEMWNGVYDETGVSGTSNNFYSLRERMWSNIIKMWNWDVNSTVSSFATYEGLRDKLGDFPGLNKTSMNMYGELNGCSVEDLLPEVVEATGPLAPEYTVVFKNWDGSVLATQTIIEGNSAVPPEVPERGSVGDIAYVFSGWDTSYENITGDTVITAEFETVETTDVGYLELKMTGGTNIFVQINDRDKRAIGSHYVNNYVARGSKVTVEAESTSGNRFIGWIDTTTGNILSKDEEFTFYTTGSDAIVALYDTDLKDISVVTFINDKTNQVIEIQNYTPGQSVVMPEDPSCLGYEFIGWTMTEDQINAIIATGENVNVHAKFRVQQLYFGVDVTGGSVTGYTEMNEDGEYLAYRGMTIKATVPSGKQFAYWKLEGSDGAADRILSFDETLKIYPYEDMKIVAVFADTSATVEKSVIVNAVIDPNKYADRESVIVSWNVPENSDFTFVNAGVLMVDESKYDSSTFSLEADDDNVLVYVPAAKNQTPSGNYSVTKMGTTDWIAMAFVQYRDANGILRVAYSDVCYSKNA